MLSLEDSHIDIAQVELMDAVPSDVPEIVQLHNAAASKAYRNDFGLGPAAIKPFMEAAQPRLTEHFNDALSHESIDISVARIIGGPVLGFAEVQQNVRRYNGEAVLCLNGLYSVAGQGIGSKLMQAKLGEYAGEYMYVRVLDGARANGFYRSWGFEFTGKNGINTYDYFDLDDINSYFGCAHPRGYEYGFVLNEMMRHCNADVSRRPPHFIDGRHDDNSVNDRRLSLIF